MGFLVEFWFELLSFAWLAVVFLGASLVARRETKRHQAMRRRLFGKDGRP